jgi:hypothetical protein
VWVTPPCLPQVESDHRTSAVNFWWDSPFTKQCMAGHMETYYARRLMASLLDSEKKRRCQAVAPLQSLQRRLDDHDDDSPSATSAPSRKRRCD